MSKKVGLPPKISGDPQKFPATTKNFRRPPKISGDDQNDHNVAGGENVTFWQLSLSKCTPANVLVGVQEKPEFGLYWVGQAFRPKVTIFGDFLYIFPEFPRFPKIRGWSTPEKSRFSPPGIPGKPRKTGGVLSVFTLVNT